MKVSNTAYILTSVIIGSMIACQPGKKDMNKESSVEIAKEANDSIFTDRKEEKDADFIVNAIAANYAEIKMAQLARNKSVDDRVKEIASKIETDHTKVSNELKAYADLKGIPVPLEESLGDSKELSDLDKQGVDKFDNDWYKAMESRHRKSISKFEARMKRTEDPDLRALISSTLPAFNSHLKMFEDHGK
ncbi:MAG: DUF4142 domain-containing protein [Chryseolinea sp.]